MLELKILDMSNENVKLKAKQKEDTTLWNGLEFKLSSTKTMCDQLTETLQHLADQVKKGRLFSLPLRMPNLGRCDYNVRHLTCNFFYSAEEDKKFFENKLSMSSNAFDDLQLQMDVLSSKLQSAEESIANGKISEDTRLCKFDLTFSLMIVIVDALSLLLGSFNYYISSHSHSSHMLSHATF